MACGNKLAAEMDESAETLANDPMPTIWPFDARLYASPATPSVSELLEAARLRDIEDAAAGPPPEVALAERTLIEIVGNSRILESVRVRAAQLILSRHDIKNEIAELRAAIEELKRKKLEEFEVA